MGPPASLAQGDWAARTDDLSQQPSPRHDVQAESTLLEHFVEKANRLQKMMSSCLDKIRNMLSET